MITDEQKALLQGVIEKDGAEITAEEREQLRAIAKELGVKIPKRACPQCWQDVAAMCYVEMRRREPQPERHYRLRPGVNILFNWERVCDATCTDENAIRWIAAGLPLEYFEQCE